MRIKLLNNTIPWFGKYSGYEIIENYFPADLKFKTTYSSGDSFKSRLFGKLLQWYLKPDKFQTSKLYKTWLFYKSGRSDDVYHLLYSENFINYLPYLNARQLARTVLTIHLPASQWTTEGLQKIKSVKNVILLYEQEMDFFQKAMPDARLRFIHLGVDTSFFRPAANSERDLKSFLFLGHYLRNFKMLVQVIKQAVKQDSELIFNLVVPEWIVQKELSEVATYKQVKLHHGISDEALNDLYQNCTAMLMPMHDSGANTAIVQGISCGCPIITTDVGGIRSYGGGSVFPLVANNDVDAMVDLVIKHASEHGFVKEQALASRNYALSKLDWPVTVRDHISFYKEVYQNG